MITQRYLKWKGVSIIICLKKQLSLPFINQGKLYLSIIYIIVTVYVECGLLVLLLKVKYLLS
jgi:hypothetical protein